MASKLTQKLIAHIRRKGIIRSCELDDLGISRVYLTRLVREGVLERTSRGLYQLPESNITQYFTLIQVAKRVPSGVICLLSALSFHNFTTQLPRQVWVAIERGKWEAGIRDLPLRFFEFSGKAFHEGIEMHTVQGVAIRVYHPAKTIADCFKYRNKIGLDVALEALREGKKAAKCTNEELWYYAKVCRVANAMRPYLEAMASV